MSGDERNQSRRRFSRAQIVHGTICLLLAAAYLALVFAQSRPRHRFEPFLELHTVENYLRVMLQREHAAESLQQSFEALPPGPLVAVYRDGSIDAVLMGFIVSYLAWPRPVRLIPVDPGSGRSKEDLGDKPLAGIFFCQVDPPPDVRRVIRLGNGLVLAPGDARRDEAP